MDIRWQNAILISIVFKKTTRNLKLLNNFVAKVENTIFPKINYTL